MKASFWKLLVVALALTCTPSLVRAEMEDAAMPEAPAASLYDRLGGEPAITAVIDDFVNRAAGDPAVNFVREGTPKKWDATPENVATLKKHLTQFVCAATGGPQVYEGKDLAATHAGMQITEAEFGAIAGDLKATLDKFNVPVKEQDELLAIVGTTKGSVVAVPEAAPEEASS